MPKYLQFGLIPYLCHVIELGEYQTLEVSREMPQGLYLVDDDISQEVLMPRGFVTDEMKVGDKIKVFVYNDSENRPVATTEKPYFTLDEYAHLMVNQVNDMGAFCDWGVGKQLFIPFRNQATRLKEGERYIVHMYLDEKSQRLVGSTKLNSFLEYFADGDIEKGEEVPLLVYQITDMGYKVIVDNYYSGLVYKNEVFEPLHIGQKTKGYVKPIRRDKKIDISLSPIGHQSIEPNAQKILDKLTLAGGSLQLNDKTDPGIIRQQLSMSKKLFKKAVGHLYKSKKIELRDNGIHLIVSPTSEEE